jgi:hypothetical protein
MADDLKYGYKGAEPTQSFGNNTGVFDPNDINNLIADNKWTSFGQLELIHTENASAVSYVDFLESAGTFDTSYNVHFLTYNDIYASTDNVSLDVQLYESGTLETAAVYQAAYQYGIANGSFGENRSTATTQMRLTWAIGNGVGEVGNGYHYFYNLADSSKYSFGTGHWGHIEQPTTQYIMGFGGDVLPQASAVNGLRVKILAGTFTGTLSLYGIRYS